MSIPCSSSTTSRSIVSKRGSHHVLAFLCPREAIKSISSRSRQARRKRTPLRTPLDAHGLEAWFFSSLTSANYCHTHHSRSGQHCGLFPLHGPFLNRIHAYAKFQRHHTTVTAVKEESEEQPSRTKKELMALVDQYDEEPHADQLPLLELPPRYQPANGPHLTVSDKVEDEWPPPYCEWPADPETYKKIEALRKALLDFSKDPEEIYLLYRALPSPRVPYLDAQTRHKLLRHVSVVEKKDEYSMIRYLSIVDDMKGVAIPLNIAEWTSAISFVARYVNRSSEIEVEAALQMWREMEHSAGVQSDEATFNVLYDVACKAGKFVLAEMIYKEMNARGLKWNHYHHTSRIHSCGLRGDGDGARAAYKDLVEAGEMVDTVVLNAVISALINSHEANAAENVYERMKRIYMEDTGRTRKTRSTDFKKNREISRTMKNLAAIAKSQPEERNELQKQTIVAPDVQTYRILITYFALRTGELDKAANFLSEMKYFNIPVHGALFNVLFEGFAIHGGIRYTQWSEDRLERVWKSYIQALDDEIGGLYISKWSVIWALNAFAKCSGKARTLEVWKQLKKRYEPGAMELDHIMHNLRTILNGRDMAVERHDWLLGSKV